MFLVKLAHERGSTEALAFTCVLFEYVVFLGEIAHKLSDLIRVNLCVDPGGPLAQEPSRVAFQLAVRVSEEFHVAISAKLEAVLHDVIDVAEDEVIFLWLR